MSICITMYRTYTLANRSSLPWGKNTIHSPLFCFITAYARTPHRQSLTDSLSGYIQLSVYHLLKCRWRATDRQSSTLPRKENAVVCLCVPAFILDPSAILVCSILTVLKRKAVIVMQDVTRSYRAIRAVATNGVGRWVEKIEYLICATHRSEV